MLPTIDATVRADVNGMLSQSVTVQAGVKQKCCLSPLLFILLLEPLLVAVRADGAIHGIDLGSHTAKASAFANDTTFLIRDTGSIPALLAWTARFGMASGLPCLTATNAGYSIYQEITPSWANARLASAGCTVKTRNSFWATPWDTTDCATIVIHGKPAQTAIWAH